MLIVLKQGSSIMVIVGVRKFDSLVDRLQIEIVVFLWFGFSVGNIVVIGINVVIKIFRVIVGISVMVKLWLKCWGR